MSWLRSSSGPILMFKRRRGRGRRYVVTVSSDQIMNKLVRCLSPATLSRGTRGGEGRVGAQPRRRRILQTDFKRTTRYGPSATGMKVSVVQPKAQLSGTFQYIATQAVRARSVPPVKRANQAAPQPVPGQRLAARRSPLSSEVGSLSRQRDISTDPADTLVNTDVGSLTPHCRPPSGPDPPSFGTAPRWPRPLDPPVDRIMHTTRA